MYIVYPSGTITNGLGKVIKPQLTPKGYLRINLRSGKDRQHKKVHAMVAEHFIGPRPEGHEIDHLDGDKENCDYRNLEYVTPKENTRRMMKRMKRWRMLRAMLHPVIP